MSVLRDSLTRWSIATLVVAAFSVSPSLAAPPDREGTAFFESKIRPLLVARCYECHSKQAPKLSGGLALDSKAGWVIGGDGGPAIIPGKPDESRLIKAVQWSDDEVHMPPKQKLTDAEVTLLVNWVRRGAPDPRESTGKPAARGGESWEAVYQNRLKWWSLEPVARSRPPAVKRADWPRNDVDRFILARLETDGLSPAPEADRWTLARRLTFALTGLPPRFEDVRKFVNDPSPNAYENLLDELMKSPHFGECWARHWMDIVHYADTHGYEWDLPSKNGWRYRDYLIRAFNDDVPFRQLVLEHLAGDLLVPPRINRQSGINEALIGPMALRLGERRHGDNSEFDGVTQEAMDNVIDTVSKSFLATTVACAHCHDHKLDALAQRDYYAWSGVFMSSRWITRTINAKDPNEAAIADLRRIKAEIRPVVADLWLKAINQFDVGGKRWTELAGSKNAIPENPASVLRELNGAGQHGEDVATRWKKMGEDYAALHRARIAANRANEHVLADFTKGTIPEGWEVDGLGARNGFARDGEFVVMDEGSAVVRHVLPAGLYTHLYSRRLEGAVRSPLLTHGEGVLSLHVTGGGFASARPIVDHALFPERATYLKQPFPSWISKDTRLTEATRGRRIYFELVTLGLDNNYPWRVAMIPGTPDGRSWFGVTRIDAGGPPQDELGRFMALFDGPPPKTSAEAAVRIRNWLRAAVERWRGAKATGEDVAHVNWMLERKLLPNDVAASKKLAELVNRYRAVQARLRPDDTVGSIADLGEGRDERIGIRGSYADLGDPAPRGNIRFLAGFGPRLGQRESGRLELARCFASDENPLTARVYVNRVWNVLFGAGLVRTLDDFGHIGEKPSHPELLDFLARRFMEEGWSTKQLIRLIVTSATWRQSGAATAAGLLKDPENRLWHHFPLRRLEAEAIRDTVLSVSGRLDSSLFGPSIDPYRRSEDPTKRLFCGPLDGQGRRSVYIKMTMMEPPKFLAEFNQPLPKLTAGRRDVTNVPNQALTLLNDPFVAGQARFWAEQIVRDRAKSIDDRIDAMLCRALGRRPQADERRRFDAFAQQIAELRSVKGADVLPSVAVWQDVAHAVFNLKEFIYVR